MGFSFLPSLCTDFISYSYLPTPSEALYAPRGVGRKYKPKVARGLQFCLILIQLRSRLLAPHPNFAAMYRPGRNYPTESIPTCSCGFVSDAGVMLHAHHRHLCTEDISKYTLTFVTLITAMLFAPCTYCEYGPSN